MKQLTWFCIATLPLALSLNLLDAAITSAFAAPAPISSAAPALPAPRPGIWTEIAVVVDGVTVRKVRDTTGGDYNVCYIASRQPEQPLSPYKIDTSPAALAITCVPEKKP